jgi:hypothetical protein
MTPTSNPGQGPLPKKDPNPSGAETIRPIPTPITSRAGIQSATSSSRPGVESEAGPARASDHPSDWISDAIHRLDETEKSLRSWISSRPMLTAAVALGAGLVASIVAQRLSRRGTAQARSVEGRRS